MKIKTLTDFQPHPLLLPLHLLGGIVLLGLGIRLRDAGIPVGLSTALVILGVILLLAAVYSAIKLFTEWLTPFVALKADGIRLRLHGWQPAQQVPLHALQSIDLQNFEPVLNLAEGKTRRLFLAHAQQLELRKNLRQWAGEHGIEVRE